MIRLPQARDFDKLRLLLVLVASGEHNPGVLGQKMGAGAKHGQRHAAYYREAAEILGLLERRRWALTARGRGLLATDARSTEEAELLRAAVDAAAELGDIRAALLSEEEPDVVTLVDYALGHIGRGSRATVDRRVKDTLSWRVRLGTSTAGARSRGASPSSTDHTVGEEEPVQPNDWPDPDVLPFNWPTDDVSVGRVVHQDLRQSDDALLVMGYTSLQELCDFIGTDSTRDPSKVRVVFGTEPFRGRELDGGFGGDALENDVREYWLQRGISIIHSLSVLRTIEALKAGRLESRISRRSQGLHAKMFLARNAATIGSSNFTSPGLRTQLEANVRIVDDGATSSQFKQAWRLGTIYWRLAMPFDAQLLALLEELLRKVTWKEALARACAELLEGQWARAYLRDELGYSDRLWPSQVQGIGQALYVLMEVGSVLIADATGSGKTKAGAWLMRALRERLVSMGRPVSDPVVVSPPAVSERWAAELHAAEVRIEVHSQGALSSGRAVAHPRVVADVESSRILALDEAHNFINPSNRTAIVNTNLADHVVLFTATPINRDLSDLLGIAELLGADNLDDDTLRILEETAWWRRRLPTDDDRARLRMAVRRFTVRRTKRNFNALIDREPNRYRNEEGDHCRYPRHTPRYYRLGESKRDRALALEITSLARSLRGLVMLRSPMVLAKADRALGWTPEKYVAMRLHSAQALAVYQVRAALRSSRAALWEHVHGTKAALRKYSVRRLDKEEAGDMLATLESAKAKGPPDSELRTFVPEWLKDPNAFKLACDDEIDRYRRIAACCDQLSDGREHAKVKRMMQLLEAHDLLVAFDSRPITLFLLHAMLGRADAQVFVATGGRPTDQRKVQKAFALGAKTRSAIALCSNSMSEGINLQQASAIIHLDMPSVVRIAEQRVGRIDRMDSPHDEVESWWPQDADEFALASGERLDERLGLVGEILGSNVELPPDAEKSTVVHPQELVHEIEKQEQRQLELLDDAFAPVRGFVEGPQALIDAKTYNALRRSSARVLSSVAVVRAKTAFGFFALPGTSRVAPRWVFVEGRDGQVQTALDEVARRLRERLADVEDVDLDGRGIQTMRELLQQARNAAVLLLPRRKQRAFQQMKRVLSKYRDRAAKIRNRERVRLLEELVALVESHDGIDLDELVDAWLATIRPRWRDALRGGTGRRRRTALRRLEGLTVELEKNALTDEELARLRASVRGATPLAERVVAAIVGVPG